MTSKNITITSESYGLLKLIKNVILSNFNRLMDENQIEEVVATSYLNREFIPYAYIFAPTGKQNQEVAKSVNLGDEINLYLNSQKVGKIYVSSSFRHKNYWNFFSIFDANAIATTPKKEGEFCLSGAIEIYNDSLEKEKLEFKQTKKSLNLQKTTAIMLSANPFHRVHERLIRMAIDKADFVILFLTRSLKENAFDFELRLKTLNFFVENFLPKDRVKVIPFNNTTLFSEHKNPELECIAAYNFGANKVILGQNHGSIGMFFDKNQPQTIIDKVRANLDIEIFIMPEFVYCDECATIVSSKTCPHGSHHHVKYHSPTIRELLWAGVLPPTILMRKDISALILSEIHPERFKNLQEIYDNIFPSSGILETHSEFDFYKELAKLYQTTSLV
ncbi:MAG: sulfate adenylyltransferase [Campylobacter sp.]|nr:sulfate adenylyltransferase [Campylobacter sp.]